MYLTQGDRNERLFCAYPGSVSPTPLVIASLETLLKSVTPHAETIVWLMLIPSPASGGENVPSALFT